MKISRSKLDLVMGNTCMTITDIRRNGNISSATMTKITQEKELRPATIGRIAKALGVSVECLVKTEI